MRQSYAEHKIESPVSFTFDPVDYSRFKFGDEKIATAFGHELGFGFIKNFEKDLLSGEQFVVLPSPYFSIPTASYFIALQFLRTVNRFMAENGAKVVEESKIRRFKTYSIDYGSLDAEERLNLILKDKYYLDATFLEGKKLIFIDDIKITGSHELVIRNLMDRFELKNDAWFLYYAEMVNKELHPNLENYLNYYYVKSLQELHEVIHSGSFHFNTRVVKYILKSESELFESFIRRQSKTFCNQLIDHAISNEYHEMNEYNQNFNYILNLITKKSLIWQ